MPRGLRLLLQQQIAKKLEVSAEKVVQRLKQLAFFDVRKLYNPDGSLKPITELDDETAAAICSIQVGKLYEHYAKGKAQHVGTTIKIKLCDRGINLERLGRYIPGLFKDKVDVAGTVSIADIIAAGRKRVAEMRAAQAAK